MIDLDLKDIITDDSAEIKDSENAVLAGSYIVDEVKDLESDQVVIDTYTQSLNNAMDDVSEVTELSYDIQDALLDPNYKGMDLVAVEQLNRRLARMSKQYGFDVNGSTFSVESFSNGDNRRITEVSLEGLIDTIKNMWEKIKEAFIKLWESIKDFWKKHLSTISRLIKKMNKLGHAASLKKGTPIVEGENKTAAGQLQRTFPAPKDIDFDLIKRFTNSQFDMMKGSGIVIVKYVEWAIALARSVEQGKEPELKGIDEVKFGDEDNPLVSGSYGAIKTEVEDAEKIKVVFEWEKYRSDKQDARKFIPGTSKELMILLKENIDLLEKTKDFNKEFEKLDSKVKQLTREITKMVEKATESRENDTEEVKESNKEKGDSIKEAIDIQKSILQLLPNVNNRVIKLNIDCAKGVILFAKDSLKTIK